MKLWNSIKNWALKVPDEKQNVDIKPTDYHPKIMLAWKACIEGNVNIINWLKENDYLEIVKATTAFFDHNESRTWLVDNGYPQLLAFVNACEGDKNATAWLLNFNFQQFHYMAKAVNEDDFAREWIKNKCTEDIQLLCQAILDAKRKIEANTSFSPFS